MASLLTAAFGVSLLSFLLTGAALQYLRRRAILDLPNERSSHEVPTPRGGGIAVVVLTLVAWLSPVASGIEASTIAAVLAAALLAAVSWIDDVRSLNPLVRLVAQIAAAGFAMSFFAESGPVFQGILPGWLDTVAAVIALVWFLNLFNFMDGIDAISVAESVAICLGLLGLALLHGLPPIAIWLPLALAAAMIGFLWWNRPPAKVFLGDVGSVPVGFLLGWLLLKTAVAGYWAAALILPLYYLADATITLVRRAVRGEKVWQAHREHFYQHAVRSGRSHTAVSGAVFAANLVLVLLAFLSVEHPVPALAAAAAVVGGLMYWMRR